MRTIGACLLALGLIITGCGGNDKMKMPSATTKVDVSNVVGGGLGNMKQDTAPAKK